MAACNVHLRVLESANKAKYSHFEINGCPQFSLPEEFKSYLVHKHPHIIAQAKTTDFKLGYFIEGRGNRKFDIVDAMQAYKVNAANKVCLWVDPHTRHAAGNVKHDNKRRYGFLYSYCACLVIIIKTINVFAPRIITYSTTHNVTEILRIGCSSCLRMDY